MDGAARDGGTVEASGDDVSCGGSGTGARGMSSTGSQSSAASGQDLSKLSYSEKLAMRVDQPELYKRLEAQQAG